MHSKPTTIKAEQLTKKFGSFTAVKAIDIEVYEGEIFGFLGANGAGKTTAIKMLCGLLPITSGQGQVAGYDIATQKDRIRRSIGYMSQKFSLYNDLSLKENIQFFGGTYGLSPRTIKANADELLARFDVGNYYTRPVADAPLGLKQRLAFMVALLHKPKLVLLDEPTSGVDPQGRLDFWELILKEAELGLSVLVTTHHMEEAEYCNRLSIMVDGAVKALGSPDELKTQYGCADMDKVFFEVTKK